MKVTRRGYARAGLIGNPSDGYFGKTISVILKNFCAEVTLTRSPKLEIRFSKKDHTVFENIHALAEDVKYYGYYKGIRLIKASIKRFYDYIRDSDIKIDGRNVTVAYTSDIPIMVGLAGSSAIITGTFRSLMKFYGVSIPKEILPTLILEVETRELKIPAGLQDRVIQVYGGCCYMDFDYNRMQEYGYGEYVNLDVRRLPPLYVAYRDELSEGTEVFHSDIRERFDRGDRDVTEAMQEFGLLTEHFAGAMDRGDTDEMKRLLNRNFDLRASLYRISDENWEMINIARNIGASSKFAGSGGAVIGIYDDEDMYRELKREYGKASIHLIKPVVKGFNSAFC